MFDTPLIQPKTYTVSEISSAIKRTLEDRFQSISIKGEISGLKRHTSGHLYLSLKDSEAVLDAICWRGVADKLKHQPEEGLEVICRGRITTYPGRSKYQFIIESLEPAGVGALLKLLEERKQKLQQEGLFDTARKKPIPFLPRSIGLITSETGAVIRDILHRLGDRFPLPVLVWPVTVQGEGASQEIITAIAGFHSLPDHIPTPDVIIIARGGGSLEDLWAFNDEGLVRAVAASSIPIISAVGHETDTTLIDYASDRRAPTPTAAAEMAVPVLRDLLVQLSGLDNRLLKGWQRFIGERQSLVSGYGRLLKTPQRLVEEKAQFLDDKAERLSKAIQYLFRDKAFRIGHLQVKSPIPRLTQSQERLEFLNHRLRQSIQSLQNGWQGRLQHLSAQLAGYSVEGTLKRGFALVKNDRGEVIKLGNQLHPGDIIGVKFYDTEKKARVEGNG